MEACQTLSELAERNELTQKRVWNLIPLIVVKADRWHSTGLVCFLVWKCEIKHLSSEASGLWKPELFEAFVSLSERKQKLAAWNSYSFSRGWCFPANTNWLRRRSDDAEKWFRSLSWWYLMMSHLLLAVWPIHCQFQRGAQTSVRFT